MRAVKLNISLVKCGRCGKRYSNPLTHTCVVRMDSRRRRTSTKVKPALSVKCGRCGHPLGNPFTHKCVTRTDFRKRKREAERPKPRRPAPSGNTHEPAECRDEDCPRYGCKQYKAGYEAGEADTAGAAYAAGRADGYSDGFQAGAASVPAGSG